MVPNRTHSLHYVLVELSCIIVKDCPFFRLYMLSITTAIDQHAYVQQCSTFSTSKRELWGPRDVPVFWTEHSSRWLPCAIAGSSTTRCTARASRLSSWKLLHSAWSVPAFDVQRFSLDPTWPYHILPPARRQPQDHSSPCCMAAHLGSADAWAGISSDSSQAVKCRYGWDMSLCQRETDPTGMHGLRMCIKDYSIRCRIKVLSLSCGWRISPPSILPTLLA